MAPMPTGRYGHSCGLVNHPERGPEIIVAGGTDSYSADSYAVVEIYTVNTNSWRRGINAKHD